MSFDFWGLMPKSQIDNEKIEEAIARIVAEHNDDPESHLAEGQSLLSHKASEVIDHLASSIIKDKMSDKSVGIDALDIDKFFLDLNWQSIDTFWTNFVGTGATIIPMFGSARFDSGSDAYSRTQLASEFPIGDLDSFNLITLRFLAKITTDGLDYTKIAFGCGDSEYFVTAPSLPYAFGFLWDNDDAKMYAFYRSGASVVKVEITGYSFESVLNYYVEAIHDDVLYPIDGYNLKFYINGNLEHETGDVDLDIGGDYAFFVDILDESGAGLDCFYVSRTIFTKDI